MNAQDVIARFRPALAPELLLEYDYFTLYPNDGGGGFVMRDELPSLSDAEITDFIFNQDGLRNYGTPPALDYHKHAAWKTIERSCWINRLYWIVPPARIACLNKDAELGRKVVDSLLWFHRNQTPPATAEEAQKISEIITYRRDTEYNQGMFNNPEPVPYQWYDFQPAARIIHIINALWFLKDLNCWNDAEAEELVDMVDTHARVIAWQEEVLPRLRGNHQALRGLSLLYAAVFLDNDCYLQHGIRITEGHAAHDFNPDGLLSEISPQYHCFETWMMRDACSFARQYNIKLSAETMALPVKNALACALTTRPDGRAVAINDGCNLNTDIFLKTLPGFPEPPEFNTLLPSKLAIWRNRSWYMLMDCSLSHGQFSHYHAGKNSINLFYQNQPFILDAGCCHYDWPEFKSFFKRGEAHASLLVDGMGDGYVEGMYNWIHTAQCTLSEWENNRIKGTVTSDVPVWQNVKWERSLECSDSGMVISDNITADRNHFYELVFPLHPAVKVTLEDNIVTLTSGDAVLQIDANSETILTIGTAPSCWCDNVEIIPSKQLKIQFRGATCQVTTTIKGC